MSGGQSGSYAESGSERFSQGSTWREKRQKRRKDREYEEQGQFGLREWLFQTYQTMPSASGCNRFDKREEELKQKDEELECL